MPMTWNAGADAKLLLAIIQVYDVKVSGQKLQEVAEIMGPECTPKALTHRLGKIRASVKDADGEGGKEESSAKTKTIKTAKSSATAKKVSRGGKKAAIERTPSPGEEGEGGILTPPDTTSRKRAGSKRESADQEIPSKKIKVEGDETAEGEGEGEEDVGA